MDGPVGEPEVGGQVSEEVEGHRRRRQEVGPNSLVIEALVTFGDGRSGPRRVECARGQEVRAGLFGIGERKAAPDRSGRFTFGSRGDRLRTDRVSLRLTPPCLVVAQPPTELGQLRFPRHTVFGFPAMQGLELFLGENVRHGGIVAGSLSPERPDLDRPHLSQRVRGRDLDRLVHAAALDEVEPADHLLGLGKRTVGDKRLPVADADGTEAGFGPASVQVVPMCQIWRRRSVWIQTTSRSASCAT